MSIASRFVPLAVLATTLLATTGVAHADDRICRGTISNQTIDGDIKVPRGASCVVSNSRIDGNIQSQGAASVTVRNSTIDGNIQLDKGRRISLRGNRVDGDIQLMGNRGSIAVQGNRVDGNLQCKGNSQRPTGGNNRVDGNKEDQCARLEVGSADRLPGLPAPAGALVMWGQAISVMMPPDSR